MPEDKDTKIKEVKEAEGTLTKMETSVDDRPKHSLLLIILLVILFLAVAGVACLYTYQTYFQKPTALTGSSAESSNKLNNTTNQQPALEIEDQSATGPDAIGLDSPITDNIDQEVNSLDQSINSAKESDFSGSDLSDSAIGNQ